MRLKIVVVLVLALCAAGSALAGSCPPFLKQGESYRFSTQMGGREDKVEVIIDLGLGGGCWVKVEGEELWLNIQSMTQIKIAKR